MVVRVVPDIPAISRRFDYAVPPGLAHAATVGHRVRVRLHGRRVAAWVVEAGVEPVEGIELQPIAASSGLGPPPGVVDLAEWAAWRWAGPVSSFLATASPPRIVERLPPTGGRETSGSFRPGAFPSPGGEAIQLVDQVLAASGPVTVRLAPCLDALRIVREVRSRLGAAGVLVLVPTVAAAAQVASRLEGDEPGSVALLPGDWPAAASGGVTVIGTRAGAWAPLPACRAVVVLDAHDERYREERAPTWSAVDVAVERARRDGAPCALVSPCPGPDLLERSVEITTSRAAERRGWPLVEVVDRRADDPRTGLFATRTVERCRQVLEERRGPVVAVLQRTGRARLLACSACRALCRCAVCGGPVAAVDAVEDAVVDDDGTADAAGPADALGPPAVGTVLLCRRCGARRPPVCAECDSTRLGILRMGVARAAEELSALLGEAAVEVTARTSPETPRLDDRLVVGTEAALHRVARAALVVFLDFDQHVLAPRYTAGEEALALVALAGRLVGGRDGTGRVVIQTRLADHEVLRAAVQADPSLLAASDRLVRSQLGLPPFGALAVVSGEGAEAFARMVAGQAGPGSADGVAGQAGPGSADGVAGQAGSGSADGVTATALATGEWLLRAPDASALADAIAAVPRPPGRLRVAIDPRHL